jgi:hypothetical protein
MTTWVIDWQLVPVFHHIPYAFIMQFKHPHTSNAVVTGTAGQFDLLPCTLDLFCSTGVPVTAMSHHIDGVLAFLSFSTIPHGLGNGSTDLVYCYGRYLWTSLLVKQMCDDTDNLLLVVVALSLDCVHFLIEVHAQEQKYRVSVSPPPQAIL